MKPENLVVVLRHRDLHEASDLGVRLVQQFAKTVFLPWLFWTVPFATLCAVGSYFYPFIFLFLFWWLVVALERSVLFSLSRAVFNAPPTFRSSISALLRTEMYGMLAQLSLLRLSPQRSANMPILQLERANFNDYFRRGSVLMAGSSMPLVITLAYATAETFFAIALYLALLFLVPRSTIDTFKGEFVLLDGPWQYVLVSAIYFATVIIIRPFYVASGFAIYLNQRTRIDGWDIELALKGLAARLSRAAAKAAKAAKIPAAIGAIVIAGLVCQTAVAQVEPTPQETIKSIKASDDFHVWVETTVAEPNFRLDGLGFLASFIQAALLALAAAILGVIIWFVWKYVSSRTPTEKKKSAEPEEWSVQSLAIASALVLPDDPASTAIELVRQGRFRESLSLCLRACISHFGGRMPQPIPDGATEAECARMISGHVPQFGEDYFRRLVRTWQQLAYAREPIEPRAAELIAEELRGVLDASRSTFEPKFEVRQTP